jgi:hypothetical protein
MAGLVLPAQALANLQRLDNFRLTLLVDDLRDTVGEARLAYEYNGDNEHLIVTNRSDVQILDAYRIDGQIFLQPLPGTGFVELNQSEPFAAPVKGLFDLPATLLDNLTGAGTRYTPAGTKTVNGRAATGYTGNVPLVNLELLRPLVTFGPLDRPLEGQDATAATTIWVGDDRNVIVATEALVQAEPGPGGSGNDFEIRLDVTDIGQVGPIAVPR